MWESYNDDYKEEKRKEQKLLAKKKYLEKRNKIREENEKPSNLKFEHSRGIRGLVNDYKYSFIPDLSYDEATVKYDGNTFRQSEIIILNTILPKSMKVIKNNNTIHQQIKKIIHESLPLKVGIWAQYVYTKNISENADKGETFMTDKEYKVYFHQKELLIEMFWSLLISIKSLMI